jgi:hypothetical protein
MRYHLRTLLATLTVIGGCLGWVTWQQRIVVERRSISRQLVERDEAVVIWEGVGWGESVNLIVAGDPSTRVSVIRRWLGDENAQAMVLIEEIEIGPIVASFPEADIYEFD